MPPNEDLMEPSAVRAESRAQVILDSIGDAVVSTDVAGNITYINPVAERMTGWPAAEACGRPLQEVVRIIDAYSRSRFPILWRWPCGRTTRSAWVITACWSTAMARSPRSRIRPLRCTTSHGQMIGAVIVFHDVGAARAMSRADVPPGAARRPDRLAEPAAAGRSTRPRHRHLHVAAPAHSRCCSSTWISFKRINDRSVMPSATGAEVALRGGSSAGVRESDTVSRHGGDEFVVLLSEVACAADAVFRADKLLAAIADAASNRRAGPARHGERRHRRVPGRRNGYRPLLKKGGLCVAASEARDGCRHQAALRPRVPGAARCATAPTRRGRNLKFSH